MIIKIKSFSMRNIFHNFIMSARDLIRQRYLTTFSIGILLCNLSLLAGCSSTAVKGLPVKDLVAAKDQRIVKTANYEEQRDEIVLMSTSHGNKSFAEISGIPEYLIGPLDVLEINSHIGDKVTSTMVTVDNRGKISYSFIDDLDVNGMAPSQLDELLTEKMSAFIKNPRIDILVNEFNSKSVTVLGEVASLRTASTVDAGSGRIYLKGKTALMDLIAMAGGYTVNADIKNVKLVRQGRSHLINLYDILERADESLNVILDDGDVVDVPELPAFGERVFVLGEVKAQGIYSLKDARDLLGAISLAGNITPLAKEENTLIVRGYTTQEGGPLVMMSDVKALLRKADLGQNIPLEDGDLVYIPRMLIGDINDWISNTRPLLDFLLFPQDLTNNYFTTKYLHPDSE
ncbi:polysaccharide export protein [Deltaproteobacteria bacterium]|nr:polysaccharide export protein [Deltaproteobacteria bacterium]